MLPDPPLRRNDVTTRRTHDNRTIQGPWASLEADQLELEAYVNAKLGVGDDRHDVDSVAAEPDWMDDAIAGTWPAVLAEADTFRC